MLVMTMLLVDDSDKHEFEKLYNKHKNEAYYIAFKILDDSSLAEDAVADGFLSIARNYKTICALDDRKKHSYIVVTIRNAANLILRKRKKHKDELEYIDEQYVPDSDITAYDSLWIKQCMGKLARADAEIIYLRYALELEHSEIAITLGISQEASRKRLQKAKQRLAVLLKEGDNDE